MWCRLLPPPAACAGLIRLANAYGAGLRLRASGLYLGTPNQNFADSTELRAYRALWASGDSLMDIVERFYIAAAALSFFLIAVLTLL